MLKELSDNQTLDRRHAITPSAGVRAPASGRPAGVSAFVVSGLDESRKLESRSITALRDDDIKHITIKHVNIKPVNASRAAIRVRGAAERGSGH